MAFKKRILFVCPNYSTFVNKDIDILSGRYDVKIFVFKVDKKWQTPFVFFRQLFFLLGNPASFDLVICQLAAYHSFLPVLFARWWRVPSLIFLGGTDCVSFPSIRYGNFNKKILGWFTAYSVKWVTHLAPKHESLIDFKYEYDDKDLPFQGIKHFVKDFHTPYTIIENGYEQEKFKCTGVKTPNTFITVAAGVQLPFTIPLKGIDLIMQVAPSFPQCKFTIVGFPENFKFPDLPVNVHCLPELPNEKLIELYSEHQFYLQLSMSEGFPNALCEAMLCECIPVGSEVNAIPEIIGNTGYILQRRDLKILTRLIFEILSAGKSKKGIAARERIMTLFSLQKRGDKLLQLINKLLVK